MAEILAARDLPARSARVRKLLREGAVLILPTDTLYGLSCNALDAQAVERINRIKRRAQPATVIPPSWRWAQDRIPKDKHAWLKCLGTFWPGATLLFPHAPKPGALPLAPPLVASGLLSVRRPEHFVRDLATSSRLPLVTTSVNRTGRPPMTSLDDLDPGIAGEVDLVVDSGPVRGQASPLWFCDEEEPRLLGRS